MNEHTVENDAGRCYETGDPIMMRCVIGNGRHVHLPAEKDRTCRHCGDPIREGEKGVDWPWIHARGFYACAGQGVTKAEPLPTPRDAAHVVTVVYDFQGRGLHSCLRCRYAGFSAPELPCPGTRVIPPGSTEGGTR